MNSAFIRSIRFIAVLALFLSPLLYAADRFDGLEVQTFDFDPIVVRACDMNQDNLPDLVMLQDGGPIYISLNDGTGGFGPANEVIPNDNIFLQTGDFNGDGRQDIITFSLMVDFATKVYLQQPDGSFAKGQEISIMLTYLNDAWIADFDNDNDLDMLVRQGAPETHLKLLVNDGSGTFSVKTLTIPTSYPSDCRIGDFNGDHFVDLVASTYDTVSVLLNDGTNQFPTVILSWAGTVSDMLVGDLDNDNDNDLVLSYHGPSPTTDMWSTVYINDGSGGLVEHDQFWTYSFAGWWGSELVNIDDDGYPDIATVNHVPPRFSICKNDGTGTFNPYHVRTYLPGKHVRQMAVADFNVDGYKDFVFTNPLTNTLTFVMNRPDDDVDAAQVIGDGLIGKEVISLDPQGDGRNDIVLGTSDAFSVMRNKTQMNFELVQSTVIYPPWNHDKHYVTNLTPIDIENDFVLDAFFLGRNDNEIIPVLAKVSYWGEFDTLVTLCDPYDGYLPGQAPSQTVAYDINADGFMDIVGSVNGTELSIFINDNLGHLQNRLELAVPAHYQMLVFDYDRNGDDDLVLIDFAGGNSYMIGQTGASTYGVVQSYSVPEISSIDPSALASIGNFDNDDDIDFAVPVTNNGVVVAHGDADGHFSVDPLLSLDATPEQLVPVDYDLDGDLDLAARVRQPDDFGYVYLFENIEGTTFKEGELLWGGVEMSSIAFSDLDQDNLPDMIAVCDGDYSSSILLHRNHSSMPDFVCCGIYNQGHTGNIDGDYVGKRNLTDITMLIDYVYINHRALTCHADGNTDGDGLGRVNLADITRLIDNVYISKNETAACQ